MKNVNENHNLRIAATARLEGILNESSLCAVWLQMGSQERDEAEFHQPDGAAGRLQLEATETAHQVMASWQRKILQIHFFFSSYD